MPNSNQEYFQAVQTFIDDLKNSGHRLEAKIVRDGFSCINGLTDGWALYLDALLKIESQKKSSLSDAQKKILTNLCDTAYRAVYRRKRTCWSKYWYSLRSRLSHYLKLH